MGFFGVFYAAALMFSSLSSHEDLLSKQENKTPLVNPFVCVLWQGLSSVCSLTPVAAA